MYELALKGGKDSIEITYSQKEAFEKMLLDSSVPNDHMMKIKDNLIRKSDIKGIFKQKESNTSELKLNTHKMNQVQADLNQISWCIFLKEKTLSERSNLNPWKMFYFSAFLKKMPEQEEKELREIEKEYFLNNTNRVFMRFDKRIERIFGFVDRKASSHLSNGFAKAGEKILGGYIRTIDFYENQSSEYLRNKWSKLLLEFQSLQGDKGELQIKHT